VIAPSPAVLALLSRLAAILVTVVVLVVLYAVLTRLIERRLVPREGESPISPRLHRLRTVSSLVQNVLRWVVAFVILVIVLLWRPTGIFKGAST